MGELPTWNAWLTKSLFRVHVSPAAADKLRRLHPEQMDKLKSMLEDIAELAATVPMGLGGVSYRGFSTPLLQLKLGPITVRYAIDENTRTLSVEHVIAPETALVDVLQHVG